MRSLLRAATLSRLAGLGERGFLGLWLGLAALGLLRRMGSPRRERVLRRRLGPNQGLVIRVSGDDRVRMRGRRIS